METAVIAQIHPVCTSRLSSPPVGQGAGEREGAPCAAGQQLLVSYGNAVVEQVNHGPNPKSRVFYPSGGYLWVRSVLFRQLLQEDLLTFFCAASCTWRSSSCQSRDAVPSSPIPSEMAWEQIKAHPLASSPAHHLAPAQPVSAVQSTPGAGPGLYSHTNQQ